MVQVDMGDSDVFHFIKRHIQLFQAGEQVWHRTGRTRLNQKRSFAFYHVAADKVLEAASVELDLVEFFPDFLNVQTLRLER
jgi:hypothetical protein